MSRPKKSRQLSPLVIPTVAVGLTLVLAGLVLFFSLTQDRIVPVPGPTVTISVPPSQPTPTDPTPAPSGAPAETPPPPPVTASDVVPEGEVKQGGALPPEQSYNIPQQRQAPVPMPLVPQSGPVAPPPVIPVAPPAPVEPEQPGLVPEVTNQLGGVVEGAGDFLCKTLFC